LSPTAQQRTQPADDGELAVVPSVQSASRGSIFGSKSGGSGGAGALSTAQKQAVARARKHAVEQQASGVSIELLAVGGRRSLDNDHDDHRHDAEDADAAPEPGASSQELDPQLDSDHRGDSGSMSDSVSTGLPMLHQVLSPPPPLNRKTSDDFEHVAHDASAATLDLAAAAAGSTSKPSAAVHRTKIAVPPAFAKSGGSGGGRSDPKGAGSVIRRSIIAQALGVVKQPSPTAHGKAASGVGGKGPDGRAAGNNSTAANSPKEAPASSFALAASAFATLVSSSLGGRSEEKSLSGSERGNAICIFPSRSRAVVSDRVLPVGMCGVQDCIDRAPAGRSDQPACHLWVWAHRPTGARTRWAHPSGVKSDLPQLALVLRHILKP